MSTEEQRNAWRQHKVPTFADVEDTYVAGLTAKQLLGIVIAVLVGYGMFMILGALSLVVRIVGGAVIAVIVAGLIAIRPRGQSLFMFLLDWISLYAGPKYYGDRVTSLVASVGVDERERGRGRGGVQLIVRIPLINKSFWFNIFVRLPFKRNRSRVQLGGMVLAVCATASVLVGCSLDIARAQVPEEYAGKRIYVQSVVVDLTQNINTGGRSASLILKSAAPLKWAGPRVNETLQSVYELNSNRTRVSAAWRNAGAPAEIEQIMSLESGDEFVFDQIYLGDRLGLRPFCEVSTGVDGYYINPDMTPPYVARRVRSKDCRIRPPGTTSDEALRVDEALSKPHLTINWEDRKRNQGSLSVGRSLLPYPGPSLENVEIETMDTGGGELLNINDLCKLNDNNVLSLGIQSERPATPASPDYFDGRGGRRIAGVIRTCPLAPSAYRFAKVILPPIAVFAGGNSDYEIMVRPAIDTFRPEDVLNRANLIILDGDGNTVLSKSVPQVGDSEFDPLNPDTVKFNISPPFYEDKVFSTDLDSTIIQIQLEIEHIVKVIRPPHQPIQFFAEKNVSHIVSCGCSRSGGGSCTPGGNCSCSCSSTSSRAWITYWEDHYRVDHLDREYLPTEPSAEMVLVFKQTLLFEPMSMTFDKPYTEFVYIEPTPVPGEVREGDYIEEGYTIGLWDSEPLVCEPGVDMDDLGRWTGWLWVAPATNSNGEAYGGCRRAYACKLDIPPVEEPFGPGGTPTEEDYDCVNKP